MQQIFCKVALTHKMNVSKIEQLGALGGQSKMGQFMNNQIENLPLLYHLVLLISFSG
jgi:hypothetical protein